MMDKEQIKKHKKSIKSMEKDALHNFARSLYSPDVKDKARKKLMKHIDLRHAELSEMVSPKAVCSSIEGDYTV